MPRKSNIPCMCYKIVYCATSSESRQFQTSVKFTVRARGESKASWRQAEDEPETSWRRAEGESETSWRRGEGEPETSRRWADGKYSKLRKSYDCLLSAPVAHDIFCNKCMESSIWETINLPLIKFWSKVVRLCTEIWQRVILTPKPPKASSEVMLLQVVSDWHHYFHIHSYFYWNSIR